MSDSGSFRIGPIKSAGKPETPSERVSAVFEGKFPRVDVTVEHIDIPPALKGKGTYVLTTSRSFSRSKLRKIGFAVPDAGRLEKHQLRQWRVPPDVMEKAILKGLGIAGTMKMSAEELTQHVRKMPGHQYSRVHNLRSSKDGTMVIDAEYGVSRRTLLEPNADIEQIKIHDTLWNHIIVPEQQMHEVLGIQETKARA